MEEKVRSTRIILNRDVLHRRFWRLRDERDRVAIHIGRLSEALLTSHEVVGPTVTAMIEEGRLRQVGREQLAGRIFQVADPATWKPREVETHAIRPKTPKWG